MERARGEGVSGEHKKREKIAKNVANYLSQNAKEKNIYGPNNGDDPFAGQEGPKRRGKCHEFCCIVFCCMDANIYYGEEKYQKMVVKAKETTDNVHTTEEAKE